MQKISTFVVVTVVVILTAPQSALAATGPGGVVPYTVRAPGYAARYLVPPNELPATNGLRLDGHGNLYVAQAFLDRITRISLSDGALTRVADESDPVDLVAPDDIALGPDGNLYVTEYGGGAVSRVSPDGSVRTRIATNLSGANGIEFDTRGRLFVSDLSFDPARPGGLWELDPTGLLPPVPVVRGIGNPEGFAFGPDGIAYVPDFYSGTISAVDVDARTSRTIAAGFGMLAALEIDASGRIVVLESDTGRAWRLDRDGRQREVIAQGEPGLDNLAIDTDGTIYVSNFARGNVRRVAMASGRLVPLLPDSPLSMPTGLSAGADGTIVVADTTSLVTVAKNGTVTSLSRIFTGGTGAASVAQVQGCGRRSIASPSPRVYARWSAVGWRG